VAGGGLDEATFAGAADVHRAVLLRFAVSLTSPADAEDVVQDALARAWSKRHTFDASRGSVKAWLLAIVADQARRRWRLSAAALRVSLSDGVAAGPSPVSADLRRAIESLPPRQREAVVLRHYLDLTVDDVAGVMRCSPGTVKSTLHDAHERLAQLLGASYARD
jgi:DNA-directed RNA polymerase specialized sigma24 family protein